MITKEYGDYILSCDICGGPADKKFDTFSEAVDYKKPNGWKVRKVNGEWKDTCPECSKAE